MKLMSPYATTCSSAEKVVPSEVAISCMGREVESVLQNFLESMKNYNNSKFQLQEREDTQAQISSLFKVGFFT